MKTSVQTQKTQPGLSITPPPAMAGLLQRKCACGGSPGFDGECEECRRKRLLGGRLQAKLRVNAPGDPFEQEAERVAEQVLRMPEPGLRRSRPLVQRRVAGGEGALEEAPPIVEEVLRAPGQPLDPATRAFFEPRFGHDFSQVRIHTDAKAAESARAVHAVAYTVGRDIVFGAGQYAPQTNAGRRLVAHELAHVVQTAGPTPTMPLEIASSDQSPNVNMAATTVLSGEHVSLSQHSLSVVSRVTDESLAARAESSAATPVPTITPSTPSTPTPVSAPTTIRVWINSFIPDPWVRDPLGYCYEGDNRGFSSAIYASYRTHQEIEFDVTTGVKTNDRVDTGTTHELDRATCTMVIDTAKAPTTGLVNRLSREGRIFNLRFDGSARNPLAWYACPIDYWFQLSIDPVARTCELEGEHDGFPAYEVYISGIGGLGLPLLLYPYDPRQAGEEPIALCGRLDKSARVRVQLLEEGSPINPNWAIG